MHLANTIKAQVPLPARLPKGFFLDPYMVDGWLRDGGMAAIYRGRRITSQQRVAIKVQHAESASDEQVRAHFDLEAEAMHRVQQCPQVIDIYDHNVLEDGRRYLVLEWIEGEDLEELIDVLRNQDQRLGIARVCRIGEHVALGLAALHAEGLVHRDLKPANIMVTTDAEGNDQIKVLDFGIVADMNAEAVLSVAEQPVLGTSAYMPPDQRAGAPADPSFDLFSLGVVLFEALSGNCVPPDGWSPENLPRVDSLRSAVPQDLADLVHSCIRSDPADRPSDAKAIADELRKIGDRIRAESPQPTPIPSARPGGTELVPHSDVASIQKPGGGTEVALTHQQVLDESGIAGPLFVPLPPETDEAEDTEPKRRPAMLVGIVALLLIACAGLALLLSGDEPEEKPATDPHEATVALTSEPGSDSPSPKTVSPAEAQAPPSTSAEQPVPATEPTIVPDKPSLAQPSAAPRPRKPAKRNSADSPACQRARQQAADARKSRDWSKLLSATKKRACWTGGKKTERLRLRVLALGEQGKFSQCVREGSKSSDREVSGMVGFCRKQAG